MSGFLLRGAAFAGLVATTTIAATTVLPDAGPAPSAVAPSCTEGLRVGGALIRPEFDAAAFTIGADGICAWIGRAADAVTHYFGRFPVPELRLEIKDVDGHGVHGGTTYGDAGGALTVIRLGRDSDAQMLERDWVMTHEMVHLAVPSVPRRSHWLEEGIATYVEPVARAQLGQLSARRIWADMFDGMPKGLPRLGDEGLDRTPTWGRTYWGGALFCLLADVAIRERTGNRKGLRDALRGVLAAGGNIEQDWPVARVLAVGDKAVGVEVLGELYRQMGDQPGPEELDSLWRRLGVQVDDGSVRFDDTAPLAAIRVAITEPDPASAAPAASLRARAALR